MATKQQWLTYVEDREAYQKAYAEETKELAKYLKLQPGEGEIDSPEIVQDGGLETPPKPPPNP